MKCKNCGFEFEGTDICPNCGYKEEQKSEPAPQMQTPVSASANQSAPTGFPAAGNVPPQRPVQNKPQFCKNCGSMIVNGSFCSVCGRSVDNKHILCTKCGNVLESNQKFCNNCGSKVSSISKSGNGVSNGAKKGILIGVIAVVFFAIMAVVAAFALPKIFVSTDTLLEQCEYEKAYQKAKDTEKEDVIYENIIACACADVKDRLKNPDSFVLEKVWLNKEDNDFVLEVKGTNSYGGVVGSYYYYSYSKSKGKYVYIISVSDFEDETIYSFDDSDERLEKSLKNLYKVIIKEIVTDDSKVLNNGIVERINTINSEGRLKNIDLIFEVSEVYPADSSSGDDV